MLHFLQRASEKNTAVTGTGFGSSRQSPGLSAANELQIARRKSFGRRPPLYGLPFRNIVGEPVAPRLRDASNDAASRRWPRSVMHDLIASVSTPARLPHASQFVSTCCGSAFWHAITFMYLSGATSRVHSCAMSPATSVGPCID